MDAFNLVARLTLDTSQYDEALGRARQNVPALSGELDEAGESASNFGSKLATAAKVAGAALATATAAAAAGAAALVKQSVDAYANYEQLVGGVETLFSSLDGSVSASATVLENASKAYETAGMSANQYMDTVTSFSAALVSSLNNDYQKAAEVSDMAIRDMSDNANKMGTSMESIQNAYQGFAKGQYQLLDNLKLGYGGTKTEMERLLADAEKFSGVKYDISNLSDVYEAIHIIQTEMGIAGTTAEEAAGTISGSFGSLSAAWENLVTGFADSNADLASLIDNVIDSAEGAMSNMLPIVENAINGLATFVDNITPKIAERLPKLVNDIVPKLLSTANTAVNALVEALPDLLQAVIDVAPQIITEISATIIDLLPEIVSLGLDLVISLANGIADNLPVLVPAAVEAVMEIAEALTEPETLIGIVDAGIQLVIKLAEGVVYAIPKIIEAVPRIIANVAEALIGHLPELVDVGGQFLQAVAQGFESEYPAISNVISGVGSILTNDLYPLLNGIIDFLEGDFDSGLQNSSTGIINTVSDTLGVIDGLINTHLQDWYDETTKFWQGFGGYLYETLNADTIADTNEKNSRETRATALRQDIQNRAKELIELGEESKSAFSQAISEYTSSADDKSIFDEYGLAEYFNDEKIKEAAATFQSEAKEAKGAIDYYTEHYKQKDLADSASLEQVKEEAEEAIGFAAKAIGEYENLGVEKILGHKFTEAEQEAYDMAKEVWNYQSELVENAAKTGEMTLNQQLSAYKAIQGQFVEGSEQYVKAQVKVAETQDKIAKEAEKANSALAAQAKTDFNNTLSSIETSVKIGDMTLTQAKKAYENLLSRYDKGSEEYQKAALKLKDTSDTIQANNKRAAEEAKKLYDQNLKDQISSLETQAKIYEWTNEQSLAAFEELQTQYAKGSDEWTQIELKNVAWRKSIRDQEEKDEKSRQSEIKKRQEQEEKALKTHLMTISEAAKKYKSEVETLQKEYADALAERTSKIAESYGLFAEVPERILYSGKDLTKNLEDQVLAIQKFYSDIDKLAQRGVSKELVSVIQSMGVGAMDQLDALLDLSDDELMKYSSLYDEKVQLSAELAEKQLAEEKAEIDRKIEELTAGFDDIVKENGESLGFGFAESFAKGIIDGTTTIEKAMEELFSDSDYSMAVGKPSSDYLATAEASSYAPSGLSNLAKKAGQTAEESIASIIVNVNGIQYQDITELAAAVGQEIQFLLNRRNAGYAGA